MDESRFDTLVKSFSSTDTRRALLRRLAPLPLAGLLAMLLHDETEAGGRRKRRKKRNTRHSGDDKENRTGKRKGKLAGDDKGTNRNTPASDPVSPPPSPPGPGCTPTTCVAQGKKCGTISDGCGGLLNCGTCTGNQICDGGSCQACDVCLPPAACTYSSINAAVAPGGPATIRICPGTYVENTVSENGNDQAGVIIPRNVRLVGAGDGSDPVSNTILRPERERPARRRNHRTPGGEPGRGRQLHITGATDALGSGILALDATLAITACTITNNHLGGSAGGGGLRVFNVDVTLTNTQITFNSSNGGGGGIRADRGSHVTLDALSRVTNNETFARDESGGGILTIDSVVELPSALNVADNDPNDCSVDPSGGTYTGPGAVCTTT